MLLPKHWVVERSFAWAARFRRLTKGYERPPDVLRRLHFLVFATPMLPSQLQGWQLREMQSTLQHRDKYDQQPVSLNSWGVATRFDLVSAAARDYEVKDSLTRL